MRLAILTAVIAALVAVGQAPAQESQSLVDRMSWKQLAHAARKEVKRGGIYSTRWGAASPWLRTLSKELIERAFLRVDGNVVWAQYIVFRESGYNPGAVNSMSRCTGLMQAAPMHWTVNGGWIDKYRMIRDPAYAAKVFVKWSKGGAYTRPWALY